MEKVKTLIIGSGPAGYTAAIYASRSNLKPVLYSGLQPGGQLTTTTIIENFPGFKDGIDANQLMLEMKAQATNVGADIRDGSITRADLTKRPFIIEDERGNIIEANTLIIATGASAKYLGLADEEKYRGQGVSACATCDGFFYRKRTVAVVGGGDTACEEAMYLSSLAKKVYMIVRKPYLRAAEIMRKRVEEKENIEILYNTNTLESATIVKLTRTLAIIPITLFLSYWQSRQQGNNQGVKLKKIFPVFILYFILASLLTTVLTSFGVSNSFFSPLKQLSKFLIIMAMSAIGLKTNLIAMIKSSGKSILLGALCWIAIILTSLGMQLLIGIF